VLSLKIAPREKLLMFGKGSSNGVNLSHYTPIGESQRKSLSIPEHAPVVGYVGRLTYAKGIPDLVRAFELVLAARPDAHLLLVGWFDQSEDALGLGWKAKMEAHPRIHITGMVHDAAGFYRTMDLLVLPTWREGFPNVVLEASASGLPVITTQSTGAIDSIIPNITGCLVPPGYPAVLSQCILDLLSDSEKRKVMGEAGRIWMADKFAMPEVLSRTVNHYAAMFNAESEATLGYCHWPSQPVARLPCLRDVEPSVVVTRVSG